MDVGQVEPPEYELQVLVLGSTRVLFEPPIFDPQPNGCRSISLLEVVAPPARLCADAPERHLLHGAAAILREGRRSNPSDGTRLPCPCGTPQACGSSVLNSRQTSSKFLRSAFSRTRSDPEAQAPLFSHSDRLSVALPEPPEPRREPPHFVPPVPRAAIIHGTSTTKTALFASPQRLRLRDVLGSRPRARFFHLAIEIPTRGGSGSSPKSPNLHLPSCKAELRPTSWSMPDQSPRTRQRWKARRRGRVLQGSESVR